MKKRKIAWLLAIIMLVPLMVACNQQGNEPADTSSEEQSTDSTDDEVADDIAESDYKIGLVTGTVSQGEEEFRAAENVVEKYGDMVKHITYPDRFAQETETTISQVASLAAEPGMKAIVITQAVPGMVAAVEKVRETNDDILFILGSPHEDPGPVGERADIAVDVDQIARGKSIVELANKMGAETFVHYSFPRHMQMEMLAARRDEMKKAAEDLDMEFVEIDAPDPTGDAGVPGAQQFIHEDVPRQVQKYGEDTAFFSTNCSMQEPLIKQVLETGAIFPEQCCPSPYHAYPGALGIEIPEDKAGDYDYILEAIAEKINEGGGSGRFGTWVRPANATMIEAGAEFAKKYAEGEVERDGYADFDDVFRETANADVNFRAYEGMDNYRVLTIEQYIFE